MDRIKILQKKIDKNSAFLVSNPYNIRYLTGFTGSNGKILLTSNKAFFFTDFRYIGQAKKILPRNVTLKILEKNLCVMLFELMNEQKKTALLFEETHVTYAFYQTLKKYFKKIKLLPSQNMVEEIRALKDAREIKYITKAQRIAEKIFQEVKNNLKPGKTEIEIAQEVENLALQHAEGVSFATIVAFQENSANPHHQPEKRKLKRGDIVLIDMGVKYKGYCSDMTRMIFTKQPTAFEEKIYNTVLQAQIEGIKSLEAKVSGKDIDEVSRKIIREAGYGQTFGHSLGHSIGLEVHESPSLSPGYDQEIPENSIVTVEPGIYLEKSFGVRIEDMVLVKRKKVLNLTKLPKKLKDCIIYI